MKNAKIKFLTYIILIVQIHLFSGNLYCQDNQQNFQESSYEIPVSIIAVSFFLDKAVQKISLKNQNDLNTKIFKIDRFYGDKIVTSLSLLGLYGFSNIIQNDNLKNLSEKAILSATVSALSVVMIKEITGRSRPYKNQGSLHFKPVSFKESQRSFPSGHAAVTFAISTIFAEEIDNIFWKTFWYGAATTVAGARIYNNKHWVSDVLAGSVIGHFIAKKTSEMYEERKATPVFGVALKEDTMLLTLSYRF